MTESIRNNIKMIKQFSEIPEMKLLKTEMNKNLKNNKLDENEIISLIKQSNYYNKMVSIFPTFAIEFEALFLMTLRDFDLGPLDFMLNTMDQVNNGNITKDKGEMSIGEHLAEKFVKLKRNNKNKFKR